MDSTVSCISDDVSKKATPFGNPPEWPVIEERKGLMHLLPSASRIGHTKIEKKGPSTDLISTNPCNEIIQILFLWSNKGI